MTIQIAVYDASRMVAVVGAEPRAAWRAAVSYVRGMAHGAGQSGPAGWFRTANREGYGRGSFRAVPARASGAGRTRA